MAGANTHTGGAESDGIAERVSAKVSSALRSEKTVGEASLALSALIAGEMAEVLAGLPAERRQELKTHSAELMQRVRRAVEGFRRERPDMITLEAPGAIEASAGKGLGAIVSDEQGERALDEIARPRKLEDWAGSVAGATELNRDFGISRSSLNRWQHDNDVIGLLKGTRKHVYPVEQFVDVRPVRGLREVTGHAGSHRVAWLWLMQPNPVLGGRRPIDLLRRDRADEVIEAATAYFPAQ